MNVRWSLQLRLILKFPLEKAVPIYFDSRSQDLKFPDKTVLQQNTMPPKKSYKSSDIRQGVTNKVQTRRGQEVDHRAELQTITRAMNKVGVGSQQRKEVAKLVNSKSNLRAVSSTENRRTGAAVKNGDPGIRAVRKQIQGIDSMRRANSSNLSSKTSKVLSTARADLKRQEKKYTKK